jgi:SOS-response transcriptional repressor LexA
MEFMPFYYYFFVVPSRAFIVVESGKHPFMDSMAERLKKARADAGYESAVDAVRAFGWTPSTYYGHENGRANISRSAAIKYARAFKVDPAWLLYGKPSKLADWTQIESVTQIPVRGSTAAGRWLEFDDTEQDAPSPIYAVAGRFSMADQFALKVSGPSMDKARIFDGDYVICVPYWIARAAPTPGDIVVVERKRGAMFERTLKELQMNDEWFELWPRSSDQRFQTPIRIKRGEDFIENDGTTIEIVGLVIGSYVPRH